MPMKQFKQVALTASIFPTDADGHELSLASVNDLTSISGFELSANKFQALSDVAPADLATKYPSAAALSASVEAAKCTVRVWTYEQDTDQNNEGAEQA